MMKGRWLEIGPEAYQKQEARLESWAGGGRIEFKSPEAAARYKETATLFKDAIQLKKPPRRVPLDPSLGSFPMEYSGLSPYQAMYDLDAAIRAAQRFFDDFQPEAYAGAPALSGEVLDLLDFKMYQWPGHGLSKDRDFQYVEEEYMRADEYQDLIDDPTGWFLTAYFPRVFGSLAGLENLPILPSVNEIVMVMRAVLPFARPEARMALGSLMAAGEKAAEWLEGARAFSATLLARGCPATGGAFVKAPFDVIGDTLRGTQQVMMDMFRRPDDLQEACDRLAPVMVKAGVSAADRSGSPFIGMPLHKGADGFMSEKQFLTFYWPSLRKVLIGLIDAGLVPLPFAEGTYNTRLEIISDLPKGTTIWMFDKTDMARAKETIGQVACIKGNVPLDLMCTGKPEEVRRYCKDLIETAGWNGGYIFSTGAGLQGARTENVRALFDAGREYGAYS